MLLFQIFQIQVFVLQIQETGLWLPDTGLQIPDSAFQILDARVAALKGVHILICPIDIQEQWEVQYGLLSRAAENRICVVASSRTKSFEQQSCAGLIATLERDFTILTPWHERKFDGYINNPLVTLQTPDHTFAVIHPNAATNKLMSANTDLLGHRPWQPCATIIKALEDESTIEIGYENYA